MGLNDCKWVVGPMMVRVGRDHGLRLVEAVGLFHGLKLVEVVGLCCGLRLVVPVG